MSEKRLGDYTFTHKLMVAWGREGKWTEFSVNAIAGSLGDTRMGQSQDTPPHPRQTVCSRG